MFHGIGRPCATNFSEIVKKGAEHMFSMFWASFSMYPYKSFQLLPKLTFNFMEGWKLCTALCLMTILKTCFEKKKLATRDFDPCFGNELN